MEGFLQSSPYDVNMGLYQYTIYFKPKSLLFNHFGGVLEFLIFQSKNRIEEYKKSAQNKTRFFIPLHVISIQTGLEIPFSMSNFMK
jgi:hypothetical protein